MDTRPDAPTVVCSATELACLARLLGAEVLLELEDPFEGWLAEDIEHAAARARETLAARGYLAVGSDGAIALDSTVAGLVRACAFPAASLVLTVSEPERPAQDYLFHFVSNMAVEQQRDDTGYRLTELASRVAVVDRVARLLALGSQPAVAAERGMIREAQLIAARATLQERGAAAAQAALEAGGLASTVASALVTTLALPARQGAVAVVARKNLEWVTGGFAVLVGEEGIWQLHPSTDGRGDAVQVAPCSAGEARAEIGRVLDTALAAGLAGR